MQNINLTNIDQILQTHGIDINSIPENQRRFHLLTIEEIKRLQNENEKREREINDLRTQIQFTNATTLNIQNQQIELARSLNITDQNVTNLEVRLNTQDNKILFLSQQIDNIKNEMSRLGQQATKDINPADITPEPLPGEEEFLKMFFLTNLSIYIK